MTRLTRLARIAGHVAIVLAWVGIVAWMIWRELTYQWDLWPYYYGAKAWAAGLDPYSLQALEQMGTQSTLSFLYPLITVYFFRFLNLFPFETAWFVWLGLKLVALGGLLLLWRRTFLRNTDGLLMSFAVLLGFNGAMPWDICAGNIAVFEQLLLWLGFAALVRGYLWQSSAAVVAMSLFKIIPAAFLGLLLAAQERARALLVAISAIVAFGLLLLLPYAARPDLLSSAFTIMSARNELGIHNPCLMGLLSHCALMWPSSFVTGKHIPLMLWAVYAAIIMAFSVKPLVRAARDGDMRYLILLAVVTYAVAMPRMMAYTYMLLIPPALLAIHHLWRDFASRMLAVAIMSMPVRFLFEAPVPDAPALLDQLSIPGFIAYYPWLLALVLWGLYISGKVKLAEDKSDAADITVVQ